MIEPPEHLKAGFGVDSKESIDETFQEIIQNAEHNGLGRKWTAELKSLLRKYRDCFRIKLGPDPPANVRPLEIKLVENARTMKSPQRRYSPHHRSFINHTIKALEEQGAVYLNNASRWASPALAVPKPGSETLRFTVDLRGPISKTEPL